jgi:hypothetical protein
MNGIVMIDHRTISPVPACSILREFFERFTIRSSLECVVRLQTLNWPGKKIRAGKHIVDCLTEKETMLGDQFVAEWNAAIAAAEASVPVQAVIIPTLAEFAPPAALSDGLVADERVPGQPAAEAAPKQSQRALVQKGASVTPFCTLPSDALYLVQIAR